MTNIFVFNPALLGPLADDPAQARDAFSSAYVVATAATLIRDVAVLGHRARAVDQRLATFTMSCDIGFASPAAFRSFTEELASAVADLAATYDEPARRGRRFRLVLGSHPVVTKTGAEAAAEAAQHRQRTHRRNASRRRARSS